jgi:hypothetical protein
MCCGTGRYNSATRQQACSACPIGKYTSRSGALVCSDCPAGRAQDIEGQTSVCSFDHQTSSLVEIFSSTQPSHVYVMVANINIGAMHMNE